MNFFAWYFTKGFRSYIEIWGNYLYFFAHYFSVWPLLTTLFSAWHKDLNPHNWRGFRPLKSLEKFVINTMLRFFGAIVRFMVLSFGILLIVLTVAVGLAGLITWFLFPLLLVFALMEVFLGNLIALSYVGILILFFISTIVAFLRYKKIPYEKMSLRELSREYLFERVLDRIDVEKKNLTDEILADFEKFKKFLKTKDILPDEFDLVLNWEIDFQKKIELESRFWTKKYLDQFVPIGRDWKYGYTVNLDNHALDLTRYDPTEYSGVQLIGYEDELEMTKLVLKRDYQNNVLLVGDPGVGKESIIHYIAKLIHLGKVSETLLDKRMMLIDLGSAISSVIDKGGDPEHALHSLFQEAAYAENIILAIDDITKYLSPVKGSSVNVVSSLDQYLSMPAFQMIATATTNEFHGLVEKHENILKNFEVIEVSEPSDEEALRILMQKFSAAERAEVIFTFQALREIVRKSTHTGKIMPLPERAIDLASETLMYWKKSANFAEGRRIGIEDVAKVLSVKTGVPHGKIKNDEKEKLLNLEDIMHKRVVGQNDAVTQLSDAVRKMRAGIGNEEKPVGSFLFLGPTGVGKTETAKALAEIYFGSEDKMMRFDMSEYQNPDGVERFIGSRKTGQPGILTSKIKDNPFSLVLLDEMEKAYPRLLDLFLQVLDEGFLTDAFGEKVSFRGAIIIATSNAGAPLIKKLVEQKVAADEVKKQLVDHIVDEGMFRVEFLNRFDDVIFFNTLKTEQLKRVVEIKLVSFTKRLDENKNIQITFEDGVVDKIVANGYDPVFGARSINRYIADEIEDVVSKKIISEQVSRGGEMMIKKKDLD